MATKLLIISCKVTARLLLPVTKGVVDPAAVPSVPVTGGVRVDPVKVVVATGAFVSGGAFVRGGPLVRGFPHVMGGPHVKGGGFHVMGGAV